MTKHLRPRKGFSNETGLTFDLIVIEHSQTMCFILRYLAYTVETGIGMRTSDPVWPLARAQVHMPGLWTR